MLERAPQGLHDQLEWFEDVRRNWNTTYNIWPAAVLEPPVGSCYLDEWAFTGTGISHLSQLATEQPGLQDAMNEAGVGCVLGAALIFGRGDFDGLDIAGADHPCTSLRNDVVRRAMAKLRVSPVIAKQVEIHMAGKSSAAASRAATTALCLELDSWGLDKKLFIPAFDNGTVAHL